MQATHNAIRAKRPGLIIVAPAAIVVLTGSFSARLSSSADSTASMDDQTTAYWC
ncbi:MAG: hypothetical protein ACJ8OJ_02235 [Povalibacter sp.]